MKITFNDFNKLNEDTDTYLKIYKNKAGEQYTHSVLKGDELYMVNIKKTPVNTWNWKYVSKINKNYNINGTLLHGEKLKGISIQLQQLLHKPGKNINEYHKDILSNPNFIKWFGNSAGVDDKGK
jgi:hypothetical protein